MMEKDLLEVRLAGRGGQGVMLAGVLLAEAAMLSGRHVVQTQSYGPEARLGTAKCDLILSRAEIGYPQVRLPHLLLCLSREAYLKYGQHLASGGTLVVDSRVLEAGESPAAFSLPITDTANELGSPVTANSVALGALVALSGVVTDGELRQALRARIKPEALSVNVSAFDAGLRLGAYARSSPDPFATISSAEVR